MLNNKLIINSLRFVENQIQHLKLAVCAMQSSIFKFFKNHKQHLKNLLIVITVELFIIAILGFVKWIVFEVLPFFSDEKYNEPFWHYLFDTYSIATNLGEAQDDYSWRSAFSSLYNFITISIGVIFIAYVQTCINSVAIADKIKEQSNNLQEETAKKIDDAINIIVQRTVGQILEEQFDSVIDACRDLRERIKMPNTTDSQKIDDFDTLVNKLTGLVQDSSKKDSMEAAEKYPEPVFQHIQKINIYEYEYIICYLFYEALLVLNEVKSDIKDSFTKATTLKEALETYATGKDEYNKGRIKDTLDEIEKILLSDNIHQNVTSLPCQ